MKRRLRSIVFQILLLLASLAACLGILEWSFRMYLFPFYATEFDWENPSPSQPGGILIAGDSYTALNQSFAFRLRDSLTSPIHITAVPGTGIREALAYLPDQISVFHPQELWYQVYLGNDFLDLQHPLSWKNLPVTRNLYWAFSDRLISLKYINYKLGGLGSHTSVQDIKSIPVFAPETYNLHEKLFLRADPDWLLDLNAGRGNVWPGVLSWQEKIGELQAECLRIGITLRILLIPHPAQVGAITSDQMMLLGGSRGDYQQCSPLQDSLHQFLESKGISFLDLTDHLSVAVWKNMGAVYFPSDPHLTPMGNEVVTNAILTWYRSDSSSRN